MIEPAITPDTSNEDIWLVEYSYAYRNSSTYAPFIIPPIFADQHLREPVPIDPAASLWKLSHQGPFLPRKDGRRQKVQSLTAIASQIAEQAPRMMDGTFDIWKNQHFRPSLLWTWGQVCKYTYRLGKE